MKILRMTCLCLLLMLIILQQLCFISATTTPYNHFSCRHFYCLGIFSQFQWRKSRSDKFESSSSLVESLDKQFLSEEVIERSLKEDSFFFSNPSHLKSNPATALPSQPGLIEDDNTIYLEEVRRRQQIQKPLWIENLPKINLRCDPLVNFKLKQRLKLLGACVTLGLDYLSDISQWRTYCSIEDNIVRGRFSLRGSELGWAKSWLLNLGLGEENTAKFKLRFGLNLKNYKFYAKLRFRTEPISPFDIGDGLSCAGKVPLPLYILPVLRKIPLRIEYKLRINAARSEALRSSRLEGGGDRKVYLSTGLGSIDVSLDELNVCLEYDEYSPLWGLGIVKTERKREKERWTSPRSQIPSSSSSRSSRR